MLFMKKLFALTLALILLCTSSALALNHKNTFDNEATFETMEEAHLNGPAWLTESGDISLSLLRLGGDWPEGIAPGDAVRVYYPVDGELLDVFGVVKAE